MYNAVVTINDTHWPAYRKPRRTLVDLRLFDPTDRGPTPRLIFRPDVLRKLGIPERLVEAAAQSQPQGLILFEDLADRVLQSEGRPNNPQNESEQNPHSSLIPFFPTWKIHKS